MMTTSQALEDIPETEELPPTAPSWYVIHTKPKQEERARINLATWAIETFFPRILDHRRNEFTGALTSIIKPLFPQYLFAKFVAHREINRVSFVRGVDRVVSFGKGPCCVDEEIIHVLRSQVTQDGFVRIHDDFKRGDPVIIQSGPLRDFTGVFERDLTDRERVSVLLTTISYQGRLLIDRNSIKRAVLDMNSAASYNDMCGVNFGTCSMEVAG